MNQTMILTASEGHATGILPDRNQGYDLARGLAVILMLFINFNGIFSHTGPLAAWVSGLIDLMDRRAAVVLVMISGAGLSMMAGRSTTFKGKDESGLSLKKQIMNRALFLLGAGGLLSVVWSGDILHFYGIFLFTGMLLIHSSGRMVAIAIGMCWLLNILFQLDGVTVFLEESDYFLTNPIKDTFFTGYFPVFPWLIFFLTGMLAGKTMGQSRSTLAALLAAGGLMTASDWLFSVIAGKWTAPLNMNWLPLVTGGSDSLPFSVVSGIGTGLLGILGGMVLSKTHPGRVTRLITLIGRTSLSIYILHILFIVAVSDLLNLAKNGLSLAPAMASFSLACLMFLRLWLTTHSRGPLETLMRKFG